MRKADPEKFCETCGARMERKRFNGRLEDRTRFLSRRNCSQSCGNTKQQVKPNSYRWRARQVQPRDRCEECGTAEKLHVHHIDRNLTNNDPANLTVLCATCHLKLHWREDREKRLAAIRTGVAMSRLSEGGRAL